MLLSLKTDKTIIIICGYTEMFRVSSELYSEFYHEMANKCHDQNSGHNKIQNEIFMIQY